MTTKKSILITGAASGIGRATALYFARRGWFTGLGHINESALEDLYRLQPYTGGRNWRSIPPPSSRCAA